MKFKILKKCKVNAEYNLLLKIKCGTNLKTIINILCIQTLCPLS